VDVVATTPRRAPRARAPRVDALRNRERIVAAARDLFTEVGWQAPIDEVARRAGIGNATVYRHFPDRDALVLAVVRSVLRRTADRAESALALGDDPFDALSRFVLAAADERIGAMCMMLDGAYDPGDPDVKALEARLNELVETMLARARRAGMLRPDVDLADIIVAVAQLTRPLPGYVTVRRSSRRYLQLFLDGLRAPGYSALTVEE